MSEVFYGKRGSIDKPVSFKPGKVRHRHGFLSRIFMHIKANRQARLIIKGLNEAQEIQSGRKKGKSFDEFLSEI